MPAQALVDRYRDRLLALLPPGKALTRVLDGSIAKMVATLAIEPARLHERALELFREAVPPYATELLGEWERAFGLPSECYTPTTIEERRAAVAARLVGTGGHAGSDYEALALLLGYASIEFIGYPVFAVGSSVGDLVFDDSWAHAKRVVTTTAGPLDDLLRCEFQRQHRAHTFFHFEFLPAPGNLEGALDWELG